MRDWNVIVTVKGKAGFTWTCELMEEFAHIERTAYYNVLVMRVDDITAFSDWLAAEIAESPAILTYVSRVVPAQEAFNFSSIEEFEQKARGTAMLWAPCLAGRSFHVRMHRRGFKGRLSTPEEERFLDDTLLDALSRAGTPGKIDFDDPDAIIGLETIDNRAGMSLWSCGELERYPFLGLD